MKNAAKRKLESQAKSRQLITYVELSDHLNAMGFPSEPFSVGMNQLLEELGRESETNHGVILTAIVVRKEDRWPGDGLMRLAMSLKKFRRESDFELWWPAKVERVFLQYS